jgi:hypothetical protein
MHGTCRAWRRRESNPRPHRARYELTGPSSATATLAMRAVQRPTARASQVGDDGSFLFGRHEEGESWGSDASALLHARPGQLKERSGIPAGNRLDPGALIRRKGIPDSDVKRGDTSDPSVACPPVYFRGQSRTREGCCCPRRIPHLLARHPSPASPHNAATTSTTAMFNLVDKAETRRLRVRNEARIDKGVAATNPSERLPGSTFHLQLTHGRRSGGPETLQP